MVRNLTPGEVKILKALEEKDILLSYTQLKEETGLSDPSISKYIKNLQKIKFVKRDIDTRKYYLTKENGRVAFTLIEIIEGLNDLFEFLFIKPK